jgi:hypothetical protein
MLEGCRKKLSATASMLMIFYQVNILLHEIALRDDHQAADFKPPYFVNRFRPESRVKEKLTAPVIDAVMQCVTFSHDLLEIFLTLDVETLRALPVYKFVMIAYAILILTKLSQSVDDPTSEIGRILDHNGLALDLYLDKTIDQLVKATGLEEFRVPSKFLAVLSHIRAFRGGHDSRPEQCHGGNEVMRPLLHLTLEEISHSDVQSPIQDEGTPEFGSAGYGKLNGSMAPKVHLSSHDNAPTMYSNVQSADQNMPSNPNYSEYTLQYTQEQTPAQPGSKPIQERGISYEMDMEPSFFPDFPEDGFFTEELDDWIPSAAVPGHIIDEQMLDLQYWGYDHKD